MATSCREYLLAEYGAVMDSRGLCKVFYYPSAAALQAAKTRGRLPFRAFEIEGRRGLFAMTDEVIQVLDRAASTADSAQPNTNGAAPLPANRSTS